MVDRGVRLDEALYLGLLAQLEAEAFGADSALVRVDKAVSLTGQGDSHFCLGFLHRLRGEFLLKRDLRNPAPAEEAYRTAIEVAKEQGARSYELLASCRSPSSINRLAASPKPTPFSRLRSKTFRRLPRCPKSPRHRRCWWL